MKRSLLPFVTFSFALTCAFSIALAAEEIKATGAAVQTSGSEKSSTPASGSSASRTEMPKYPPFAEVIKDAETVEGLVRMHHKGTRLFAELNSSHFNRDFIVLISIARG